MDKALEKIKCILQGEITWVTAHQIPQSNLMEQTSNALVIMHVQMSLNIACSTGKGELAKHQPDSTFSFCTASVAYSLSFQSRLMTKTANIIYFLDVSGFLISFISKSQRLGTKICFVTDWGIIQCALTYTGLQKEIVAN